MSDKTNICIRATVFNSNIPPVETKLLPTITGSEIIDHVQYLLENEVNKKKNKTDLDFSNQKYVVLLCYTLPPPLKLKVYKVLPNDSDLNSFLQIYSTKILDVILYPAEMNIKVVTPDDQSLTLRFESDMPASKIIEKICKDTFHMDAISDYGIYTSKKFLMDPISGNRSLIEVSPSIETIYLLRRFWLKTVKNISKETEIDFNYRQAKNIVFDEHFYYKYFKYIELVAISLIIEFDTEDNVLNTIKKNKRKESSMFPKWVINDKSKKLKKQILSILKNYEKKYTLELKKLFLEICLENQYFGALEFPVNCCVPGKENDTPNDYSLIFTENKLCLLIPGTYDEIYNFGFEYIKKWKQLQNDELQFSLSLSSETNKFKNVDWNINTKFSLQILEFFTSLANLIKKQKLDKTKKEKVNNKEKKESKVITHKVYSQLSMGSSLNDLLASNSLFINDEIDNLPSTILIPSAIGSEKIVLDPLIKPIKQNVSFINSDSLLCKNDEYGDELESRILNEEDGFSFEEGKNSHELNSQMIEMGCNLFLKITNQESFNPLSEASKFIQSSLSNESKATKKIFEQLLQGPSDSLIETISTIGRCFSYLFLQKIPPLDSFASINFIYILLNRLAVEEWKEYDFLSSASSVDKLLKKILTSIQNTTHNMNLPLSTALLEAFISKIPNSISLLALNETIILALYLCCISISRTLIEADIEVMILEPILYKISSIPSYDPFLAFILSTELKRIMENVQNDSVLTHKFLSQPHDSRIEFTSIMNCITELNNLIVFQRSPIAMLIKEFSPRMKNVQEIPHNIIEAVTFDKIAKEMAFLLFGMNNQSYISLSYELCFRSSNLYNIFLKSYNEYNNSVIIDLYKKVTETMNEVINIIQRNQSIYSLLDTDDIVHSLLKLLLSSSEDTFFFISMEANSPSQRSNLIIESAKQIESILRKVNDKCSDEVIRKVSDFYRVFSMNIILITKYEKESLKIINKLYQIGQILLSILKEEMKGTQRNEKILQIKNLFKAILPIAYDEKDSIESFLNSDGSTTIQSYRYDFSVKKPDISSSQDILSKLSLTLQQFKK